MIKNLPVKMHLTGQQFTGHGTQILWGKARLHPDLRYKDSINRVDETDYKHDICYPNNRDTKTRNEVCDKEMLLELN